MLARELLNTINQLAFELPIGHYGVEAVYAKYCFNKITKLLAAIDQMYPDVPLNEETAVPLAEFLCINYVYTKHTDLAPTQSIRSPHTIACLTVALALEEIFKISRYKILHPELEVLDYVVTGTSVNDVEHELSSFIMTDDGKRIIEIQACLSFAESDGILKHTSLIDGQAAALSENEAKRVVDYIPETRAYWDAINYKIEVETKGENFGSMITNLIASLREGGVKRNGQELKAGNDANVGIIEFSEWFDGLEKDEQALLLACSYKNSWRNTVTFEELYARLITPQNFTETIYCVEVLGGSFELLLSQNKQLFDTYPKKSKKSASAPSLKEAVRVMEAKKLALASAMKTHRPRSVYGRAVAPALAEKMIELSDLFQHVPVRDWKVWFEEYLKQFKSEPARLYVVQQFASAINKLYRDDDSLNHFFNLFGEAQLLPLIEILESANAVPAKTFNDYSYYMFKFNGGRRDRLIEAKQHLISSFDDLIILMRLNRKTKYAEKYKQYIDSPERFWEVVELLPGNEETFDFVMHFLRFITDKGKLVWLANKFDNPLKLYLYVFLTKACFSSSAEISVYGPSPHPSVSILDRIRNPSLELLEFIRSKEMTNGNDLQSLLAKLKEGARFFVAEHYRALIQNGNELSGVLALLAREDRLSYLQANESCIQDGDEIAKLLTLTQFESDEEKLKFAESHIHKVTCDFQLANVLGHFQFHDGCYLMRLAAQKSKAISSPSMLVNNSYFCTPRSQSHKPAREYTM